MRFYVAGAAVEIERAKKVIAALIAAGHTCTHDWTVQVEEELRLNPDRKETELPDEDCRVWADEDLRGVETADVYVLIPSADRGRGSWVELGYALREARLRHDARFPYSNSRLRLYVIGPHARASIFTRATPQPTIFQGDDDKALNALLSDLALAP